MMREAALSPRNAQGLCVLMTLDAVGGVWRYAMDLAAGLRRAGVRIAFLGFGPEPGAAQRAEASRLGSLDWSTVPLDWMARDAGDLDAVPGAIVAAARDRAADLLHLNLPSQSATLDLPLPVVAVSHSCVVTWFRAVRGQAVPPDWRWQEALNLAGLRRADAVIAPSQSHARLMQACYGPLPALRVVRNASRAAGPAAAAPPFTEPNSPEPAARAPSATDARRPLADSAAGARDRAGGSTGRSGSRRPCLAAPAAPAEENAPFALAMGRWWDEGKNAATLDAAASHVHWPVVMLGAAVSPDGTRVAIRHADHRGEVPHDRAAALAARCGIFVSPSTYEPFGLAALEAARAGVPLLLADIPTYRELWDGAAQFFPPRDARALAAAANALADDPAARRDLGRAAARRAERYDAATQTRAMLVLYRALVESARSGDRTARAVTSHSSAPGATAG